MNRILIILSIFFCTAALAQPAPAVNKKDSQGRKQGVWKKPYKGVKVFQYVGQFKDDVPYGEFRYYYKNGKTQAVVQFSDNGKTTRSKMYHHSGYLMAMGKYINQKKDSVWVYFDDRGKISYQETFERGMLNGQKVYFYEPREGKYPVARYEYYKDSLLHGEFKEYHENTKVKTKGNYVNGRKHGVVTHFYPDGKIKKVAHYKNGLKHGNWAFYDEKGAQLGTKMFWDGHLLEGPQAEAKRKEWEASRKRK